MFKENTIKMGIISFLILATVNTEAKVYNYFANGVDNSEDDARRNSGLVQKLTGIKMEEPLYNSTYGFVADALEATQQSLGLDEFYKLFIKFMDAGSKEAKIIQSTMQKYKNREDQKITLKAARIYSLVDKTKRESDDDTSNNYFRMGFTTQPKSN